MPSRKVHLLVDKLFLRKTFPKVHRFMDYPSKYLGKSHRVLRHDLTTAFMLGLIYGSEAFLSSYLHILTDKAFSRLSRRKRKILKALGMV
ncbi:MAG: hypothetical protein ACTSR0_04105 [Candidatus Asgardarchaeia archaeon]